MILNTLALIVTPAVLLHELAHKGVGIYFGYDSILKISLFGLGLGVILKYFNSPIIFLCSCLCYKFWGFW